MAGVEDEESSLQRLPVSIGYGGIPEATGLEDEGGAAEEQATNAYWPAGSEDGNEAEMDSPSKHAIELTGGAAKAHLAVSGFFAQSYLFGANTVSKVKSFDDRHHLTRSASAQLLALGLSALEISEDTSAKAKAWTVRQAARISSKPIVHKVVTSFEAVNARLLDIDERYKVTAKTDSVFTVVEQVVSGVIDGTAQTAVRAGNSIMNSKREVGRLIADNHVYASSHAWVEARVESVSAVVESVSLETSRKIADARGKEERAQATELQEPEEVTYRGLWRRIGSFDLRSRQEYDAQRLVHSHTDTKGPLYDQRKGFF
eukprot:TRINITY_DN13147_c0_g1_i1.p1 TRINITY_DN13147_c0_g1~~TRINITY_DN13147_c0_g1_i1.p1  ORF type:complete len:316 (+),score=30.66 TRINITY_DN13147_c0_g1_i1:850-1797(+)